MSDLPETFDHRPFCGAPTDGRSVCPQAAGVVGTAADGSEPLTGGRRYLADVNGRVPVRLRGFGAPAHRLPALKERARVPPPAAHGGKPAWRGAGSYGPSHRFAHGEPVVALRSQGGEGVRP